MLPLALARLRPATTVLRCKLRKLHSDTPAAPINRFLVFAPDKTDEGAFQRRLSVRPQHLEVAGRQIEQKFIRVGGVLLSPESLIDPENKKMVGSCFICAADTIEEVKKKVEDDIYYKAGVWDPEKIVILPFVPAAATPV